MRLLPSRVFLALGIAALIFLVLSGVGNSFPTALTGSWEYALEWAEGVIAFSLLFFLISSVMKTKHLNVYSDPDRCSDIGTLLL